MASIHQYFDKLEQMGASDLHLSVNVRPMVRLRGDLQALPDEPMNLDDLEALVKEITPPQQWEQFLTLGDVDFLYEYAGHGRLRANLFRQRRGIGAVFRFISTRFRPCRSCRYRRS